MQEYLSGAFDVDDLQNSIRYAKYKATATKTDAANTLGDSCTALWGENSDTASLADLKKLANRGSMNDTDPLPEEVAAAKMLDDDPDALKKLDPDGDGKFSKDDMKKLPNAATHVEIPDTTKPTADQATNVALAKAALSQNWSKIWITDEVDSPYLKGMAEGKFPARAKLTDEEKTQYANAAKTLVDDDRAKAYLGIKLSNGTFTKAQLDAAADGTTYASTAKLSDVVGTLGPNLNVS